MLGRKQGEAGPARCVSGAAAPTKHRGLELRRSPEKTLQSRPEFCRGAATSSRQVVQQPEGDDPRTALQTSRSTFISAGWFLCGLIHLGVKAAEFEAFPPLFLSVAVAGSARGGVSR